MKDTSTFFRVHLPSWETTPTIDPWASCSDPQEIIGSAGLSIAEKRRILSSWASDARAVADAPALRRLDDGSVVGIDEILSALQTLDRHDSPETRLPNLHTSWRRRHRVQPRRWLPMRLQRNRSDDDDDDDPPPCPAVISPVPGRPPFGAEAELEAA
jgi:hypothetical protein